MTDLAIITEEFRPSKKGGIATWAHGIALYFGERIEYDVTVFVKKRGGINLKTRPRNLPYKLFLMGGRDWSKFKKWYISYYLKEFIKKSQNPVIISATWELAQGLLKYKQKYPFLLITILHGLEVTRLNSRKYYKRIPQFQNVLKYSNQIIAVSDYTKKEARSIGGDYEIETIPNFVNTNDFYPESKGNCRKHFEFDPNDKILLTLSRLVKRKGHAIVIKALPMIKGTIPNIKYVIAGDGNQSFKEELNQLIAELGLENNVLFLGYIHENQKRMIYNASDIYIMNSMPTDDKGDSEGFGITFLEANACGIPVIGSRAGGISNAIKHKVNGLMVSPNRPDETANAILNLFNDISLYNNISNNAVSRVNKHFSLSNIGKDYKQIISRLSAS
ncbi:MAG: glycosyltransferase family 4 protein [Candidatus Marinimicrobia bacterium]|nr:glycosyltransferase family 4 protein [Candidatus Neomarinimicrobiota bacterium]